MRGDASTLLLMAMLRRWEVVKRVEDIEKRGRYAIER